MRPQREIAQLGAGPVVPDWSVRQQREPVRWAGVVSALIAIQSNAAAAIHGVDVDQFTGDVAGLVSLDKPGRCVILG